MDNIYEISTEIMALAATIEEGLGHLNKRMGELHFEDTRYLFNDIVEAYLSIMNALEGLMEKLAPNELVEKSGQLQVAMEKMNHSYEANKVDEARMDMQFILFPAFKAWMGEMEKCIRPLAQV